MLDQTIILLSNTNLYHTINFTYTQEALYTKLDVQININTRCFSRCKYMDESGFSFLSSTFWFCKTWKNCLALFGCILWRKQCCGTFRCNWRLIMTFIWSWVRTLIYFWLKRKDLLKVGTGRVDWKFQLRREAIYLRREREREREREEMKLMLLNNSLKVDNMTWIIIFFPLDLIEINCLKIVQLL